jgi:hypothetical protein
VTWAPAEARKALTAPRPRPRLLAVVTSLRTVPRMIFAAGGDLDAPACAGSRIDRNHRIWQRNPLPQDLGGFRAGEALVSDAIQPMITQLVLLAAAVVDCRGGMLIHGAIIARELGIPSVNSWLWRHAAGGVPDGFGLMDEPERSRPGAVAPTGAAVPAGSAATASLPGSGRGAGFCSR